MENYVPPRPRKVKVTTRVNRQIWVYVLCVAQGRFSVPREARVRERTGVPGLTERGDPMTSALSTLAGLYGQTGENGKFLDWKSVIGTIEQCPSI